MISAECDFVFVISPGRSGTAFCAALFGASCRASSGAATVVRHEPLPVCGAAAMRLFNVGRVRDMQRLAAAKWRTLQAARPRDATYVESNAQFIKAFGWCLPDHGASVGVLELHRDADRVVASFVANGEAPLFTAFGDVWNLSPDATAALTPPPAHVSPRAAIAWQIAEIAARAAELRSRSPALRWHTATLDDLSTVDGATAALAAFGLRPRDAAALAAVLADTAINSGAERAHAASGINDAEAARVRPPRQWPHTCMADNVAHVDRLVDALLAQPGAADRIRAHTRPLLGIGASCMVGAKRELVDPALAFSELHFQLICSLVARVAPDDVLFSFVQRVGGVWQLCDRINSADEPPPVAALPPPAATSQRFVVVVVGASGRLAPFVLTELLHWFATLRRPVAVRLVARAPSLARTRGVAADLLDTNDAVDLAVEIFTDEQLSAALHDADLTLLLASASRERFDERHDLAARNTPLFEQLADALAPGRCRIVVVANPTMMLASVLCRRQPSLQRRVTALLQCDAQRATGWLAARLRVAPHAVVNVLAVGNHSLNVHIDTSAAFVRLPGGGACLLDDCLTPHELGIELPRFVHQRGRELISLTGHTALLSVARCVVRHAQHLFATDDDDDDDDDNQLLSAGVFVDTRRWRAQPAFDVPRCLPRRTFGFADVWPLETDFVGFLGMPVRKGGAVDWMAWMTALRAPEARVRLAASVRELTDPQPVAMPALLVDELTLARVALCSADCVLVLAGAGLSADVIPDLLSFDRQFAACVARGDRTIFHVSNFAHFESAPTSAWGFFASRALAYGRAALSPATQTLARWLLARAHESWFVETSNLDGQLRRAGLHGNVFERHGTLFDVQCTRCDAPVERRDVEWFDTLQVDAAQLLVPEHCVPRCGACGAVQRIATALAVDPVPFRKQLQREQRERRDAFARAFLSAPLSVVLEIGVGVQMPKLRTRAAALKVARRGLGRRTVHVRVNKLHHAHTGAPHADDLEIPLDAGAALAHLCRNHES